MALPDEVESRIAGAPVSAHLATTVDDRPHVAPVWYGYRDEVVYFLTGGTKLANLRRNPRVAISIEAATEGDVEWNVTLLGRARVHDDPDRIERASDWIYDKYETGDGTGDDAARDDGSETPDDGTGGSDAAGEEGTGGSDASDGEEDYALVEVRVGSTAWNVYE